MVCRPTDVDWWKDTTSKILFSTQDALEPWCDKTSSHLKVTGSRRYSRDLPQGGLEVPCTLKFQGSTKDIDKVKTCSRPPQVQRPW